MTRCPLSTLLAAAWGTAALSLVSANAMAQGAASKPKSTPPAAAPTTKPAVPAAANTASANDSVVGICNSHKVPWGQLVAKIRQDQPALINQSIAGIVAGKASEAFFGAHPAESFTITKAQAL